MIAGYYQVLNRKGEIWIPRYKTFFEPALAHDMFAVMDYGFMTEDEAEKVRGIAEWTTAEFCYVNFVMTA